jgi:hypothetical protein
VPHLAGSRFPFLPPADEIGSTRRDDDDGGTTDDDGDGEKAKVVVVVDARLWPVETRIVAVANARAMPPPRRRRLLHRTGE